MNALPRESVDLFKLASAGKSKEAFELYRWFLPLLRMDTVPKFIQLIKQVQQEAGIGSARVRPPGLNLGKNCRSHARLQACRLESGLPLRVRSTPLPSTFIRSWYRTSREDYRGGSALPVSSLAEHFDDLGEAVAAIFPVGEQRALQPVRVTLRERGDDLFVLLH